MPNHCSKLAELTALYLIPVVVAPSQQHPLIWGKVIFEPAAISCGRVSSATFPGSRTTAFLDDAGYILPGHGSA